MRARAKRHERKVRTTISLPKPLYEEARLVVNSNATPADSINGFIVAATAAYVKLFQRKEIDAQFNAMAEDGDYQKKAKLMAEEFATSDWEALEGFGG